MKKQNGDFICEICGKPDMIASRIRIEANYGSVYDGMRLTLNVCGDCVDRIIKGIIAERKVKYGVCKNNRYSKKGLRQ